MLTRFKTVASDGTVADTPANCFRYRVAEEWHGYFSQGEDMGDVGILIAIMGAGTTFPITDFVTKTVEDRWLIELRTPDDVVIFKQYIGVRIQVTALVTAVGGMTTLGLFTWYAAGEAVNTTHFGVDEYSAPVQTSLAMAVGPSHDTLPIVSTVGLPPRGEVWLGERIGATTRLSGAVGAGDTTLPIVDDSGLPDDGEVLVGLWVADAWADPPERVGYAAIRRGTNPALLSCRRGIDGTTARGHSDRARVHMPTSWLGTPERVEYGHINDAISPPRLEACLRAREGTPAQAHPAGRSVHKLQSGHRMAETTLAASLSGEQPRKADGTPDLDASFAEVEDAGAFPDAGSVYIGKRDGFWWRTNPERIDYEGKDTTRTPHRLLRCLRGRLGRSIADHDTGDPVVEAPGIMVGPDVGTNVPGGGSDYTGSYGLILFDWDSPVYRLAVPGGSRVRFAGHWIGQARLPMNLNIVSTQVCAGETWAALYVIPTGYWWTADTSAGDGILVQVVADLRALPAKVSHETASPQNPAPAAPKPVLRVKAGRGACTNPILVHVPGRMAPGIVYTRGDRGHFVHLSDLGDEWSEPVRVSTRAVIASAFCPSGNLYLVLLQGTTLYVGVTGSAPDETGEIVMREAEEWRPLLRQPDGSWGNFPPMSGNRHALEIPRPGHLMLLAPDGAFFESADGGRTWRQ